MSARPPFLPGKRPATAGRGHARSARIQRASRAVLLAVALLRPGVASSTSSWVPLTTSGGPPAPRRYHSSVYDPASDRLILFGGCLSGTCQTFPSQPTNEVWVLTNASGLSGTPTWIPLSPSGPLPPARFLHASAYDAVHNRLIVWSGDSAFVSAPDLTDVWVLTNANGLGGAPAWTQLFPTGGPPPGATFAGREFLSAVYDPVTNRMIVFGGASCDPCAGLDDVWALTNANGLGGPPAWEQLFPTGGPPSSHYAHSAVFDAAGNRMIVFGGIVPGGLGGDAWVLANASGIDRTTGAPVAPAWTPLPSGPEPRYFHAAAYDPANNRMVVFGGLGDSGYRNDVWVLDHANGTGGTPAWSLAAPAGTSPDPRAVFDHSQLFDPVSRRLIVFGGDPDPAATALTDSWVLTEASGAPASTSWIELSPAGGPPPPRRLHSTVYDSLSNRLIVFGGCTPVGDNACVSNGGIVRNDVWVLTSANGVGDPPTWIELLPTGGPPPARQSHLAVYDPANNRMIITAGEPTGSFPIFTDVWVLTNANGLDRATGEPATPSWIPLSPSGTFPPPSGLLLPGREGSAAAYDPVTNRMILFGGGVCDPCQQRNDVWVLTEANGLGATPQWLPLSPTGGPPGPRAEHSLTYDVVRDRMIVFGGGYPPVNDTWVLLHASGLDRGTGDPVTPVWTPLTTGPAPPVRSNHAAAFGASTNRQVIFGGRGADTATALGDVWLLENANGTGATSAWTQTLPGGTPPDPRWVFQHFQLYDEASNRMIVFGGDPGATTTLFSDVWVLTEALGSPLSGESLGVDVHGPGSSSNLNGVLEPGESVIVDPSWANVSGSSLELTGAASLFDGPPAGGATYSIVDGAADYGSIAGGATSDCFTASQNCYELAVAGPRPTLHWDATFTESLSWTLTRTWTLHVGESFGDVPTTNLFYRDIENIFHHLVTIGCTEVSYCPDAPALRKQMAVFVLKAKEGASYVPPPATGIFSDVPASDPFAPWIEELYRRGVVEGCVSPGGSKAYCPDDPVLRQQMAIFLLLTREGSAYTPPPCTGVFADVPCPGLFTDWIEDLSGRAITVGCGGENYCPKNPTTRDQMAPFLVKTFGLVLYGP